MTRTPPSREEKLNKLYAEIEKLEHRLEMLNELSAVAARDEAINAVELDIAEKQAEIARLEDDI